MLHRNKEFLKPSKNRPADRTELEESLEPEAESVEPWQQDDQLTENIVHIQPSDVHPISSKFNSVPPWLDEGKRISSASLLRLQDQ